MRHVHTHGLRLDFVLAQVFFFSVLYQIIKMRPPLENEPVTVTLIHFENFDHLYKATHLTEE